MSINVQERALKIPIPLSGTEGNIIEECLLQLPAGYPGIVKVVYAEGIVDFREPVVELGQVVLAGTVDILLLYQSQVGAEVLYKGVTFPRALEFTIPAEIADLTPDAKVAALVEVESITATVGKDGNINCDVVLAYEVEAMQIHETGLVTEITAPDKKVKVTKDTFAVKDFVGTVEVEKTLEAAVSLAQSDLPIAELLRVGLKPRIDHSRCLAGKVVIEGSLDVELAYLPARPAVEPQPPAPAEGEGEVDDFALDFPETTTPPVPTIAKKVIPNGIKYVLNADLAGADPEKKVEAKVFLTEVGATVAAGNKVELMVRLKGQAQVVQELQLETVIAAEIDGDERIDLNRRMLLMPQKIAGTTKELVVSATPGIAASKAELKEILFSSAKPVVSQCKIAPDKLTIAGKVRLELVYLGENELGEETIDHLTIDKGFDFKEVIDLPGIEPGMLVKVAAEVPTVAVGIVDPFTLEANLLVVFNIEVCDLVQREIVLEAAVAVPAPKDSASIRVVVAQKGDTLWKLARKYGTTVEFLAAYNKLGEAAELTPGQRLRIPSRY